MNLIPAKVGLMFGKQALALQRNSPQILFGAGVAGVFTSTVLACRATLKTSDILQEAEERKFLATSIYESGEDPNYIEQVYEHDIRTLKIQTAIRISKQYIPPAIILGLSLAAFAQSNRILTQRNAALAAAYTALDKGFRQYRQRVIEDQGEEADLRYRYGSQEVEITNPDTGRKKKVLRAGPNAESIYAKFFDPSSMYWEKEPGRNLNFLLARQNYANDKLRSQGYIFLNDVYDMLDIAKTQEGTAVGWRKDGPGDGYVSFGISEGQEQKIRDFLYGHELSILLDFNVDGPILNVLEKSS